MFLQEFPVRSSGTASAVTRQIQAASASSAPRRGSEYAELSRQVKDAGLMVRRPGYYAWKIAVTVGLLAAGWTVFVVVGNSWWQLAVARSWRWYSPRSVPGPRRRAPAGFGTRRASYVAGILLGNLGIGLSYGWWVELSYGWWVDKHNRHHAHPNTDGADPDIDIAVMAFTGAQAQSGGRVARLMFRYQAYLFFPMLLLEGVSLHVASIRALTSRASRHRPAETVLLAAHVVGYLAIVMLVLSPVKVLVFVLVQQGLFGVYLGSSFAPNHKV